MRREIREQNRQVGELLTEFIKETVGFYDHIEREPVCRPAAKDRLAAIQEQTIPAKGRPVEEVFREMQRDIYSSTILGQHPRSFSCVPSTMSLVSWMGDVMTGAYNPHASCTVNAPAADLVEKKLIRWMCGQAGYPEESGGLFVSGGSIANLTALTAARDAKLTWEERGKAVVYVSGQTHSSVAKGLHIIGFGREQIRVLPVDREFCMDLSALRSSVRKDMTDGNIPFAVVASAGTTNTGSVDPLAGISAICRKYDMWMHVDGAFGASALLSSEQRKKLDGIELSDSLSWDAHKWMMQTYGCSAVLVRNQSDLVRSFAAHPEYLKDAETSEEGVEFWDLGPELTRPARGLKLWLTLQTEGTEKMGRMIDHGCRMAELAGKLIQEEPEWEIISGPSLGVVNFRYIADGTLSEEELDSANQHISAEITESGFAQIFTTELGGKKVLRMCTINPETTEEDIRRTIEKLTKAEAVSCLGTARNQSRTA